MRHRPFAFKSYLIALLTLLLGGVMSVVYADWNWFARSGSLVVINGIILTSHQIIEHINRLKRDQLYRVSQFGRDWASSDKEQLIHDPREGVWRNEKYGLYMLIIGTVVWGFGYLINGL